MIEAMDVASVVTTLPVLVMLAWVFDGVEEDSLVDEDFCLSEVDVCDDDVSLADDDEVALSVGVVLLSEEEDLSSPLSWAIAGRPKILRDPRVDRRSAGPGK